MLGVGKIRFLSNFADIAKTIKNDFGGFREVLDLISEVLKRSLGLAVLAGLADWVVRHASWLRCLAGWLIAVPRILRPA